jgi:hypothetical protein
VRRSDGTDSLEGRNRGSPTRNGSSGPRSSATLTCSPTWSPTGIGTTDGTTTPEFARELLALLPAREREVIAAHFGVDGAGPLTLAAVGQRAGISRQEASALYRRGLERIRVRLGVELPRRDPREAHSPCPGVFRMPSGRFWVRINIGDGKCARGGTHATLDEAKVAANRLAKVRLNIDGYTDRPRSTRRPR